MTVAASTTPPELDRPRGGASGERRDTARSHRPRSPLLVIGLALVGLVVVVALAAPILASHAPTGVSGRSLATPSASHWLGTDDSGRDIFAELVYGARASLVVGVVSGCLAMLGAVALGVLPALVGGAADSLSHRLIVFLLALPALPLIILIGSLAGNRRTAVILVIAFLGVAPNARVLRGQAQSLRRRGFIGASRGFGGGPLYVLRRHLLPGLGPLLVVRFVNWAGVAIGLEAGLSFLGLGDPSGVSWGMMMNRALNQPGIYFSQMWTWWVIPPGLAITLTVLGFTFVGVGLEPSFNPRWLRTS